MKSIFALMILLLSGCGMVDISTAPHTLPSPHQGGNTPPPPSAGPPPPPLPSSVNPAGIWDVSESGLSEVVLMANDMYFSLAAVDEFGCPHISGGDYTVHGSTFTGSGVTALLDNCAQPNYFTWTLTGSLMGGVLDVSLTDASITTPAFSATLDPLYTLYRSSLSTLVGNWDDAGNVLTVDPDGSFFEQQSNGCALSGAITVIDPAYNLYGVSFMFDSVTCTNSIAGIPFQGLAYLTPNNSSGWYHLLLDAIGADANGARVVVFDSLTPYFTPPTG